MNYERIFNIVMEFRIFEEGLTCTRIKEKSNHSYIVTSAERTLPLVRICKPRGRMVFSVKAVKLDGTTFGSGFVAEQTAIPVVKGDVEKLTPDSLRAALTKAINELREEKGLRRI